MKIDELPLTNKDNWVRKNDSYGLNIFDGDEVFYIVGPDKSTVHWYCRVNGVGNEFPVNDIQGIHAIEGITITWDYSNVFDMHYNNDNYILRREN